MLYIKPKHCTVSNWPRIGVDIFWDSQIRAPRTEIHKFKCGLIFEIKSIIQLTSLTFQSL